MSDTQSRSRIDYEALWSAAGKAAVVFGALFIAHEFVVFNAKRKRKQAACDKEGVVTNLTKEQWAEFWDKGYVKIGRTLSNKELNDLKERVNDIMTGKIKYGDKLLMQADQSKTTQLSSKDDYDNADLGNQGQSTGFKGSDVKYRKIGESGCGLECDDKFLSFMQKPVFKRICEKIYGKHAKIGMYRAMIFNKPAEKDGGGSFLPCVDIVL